MVEHCSHCDEAVGVGDGVVNSILWIARRLGSDRVRGATTKVMFIPASEVLENCTRIVPGGRDSMTSRKAKFTLLLSPTAPRRTLAMLLPSSAGYQARPGWTNPLIDITIDIQDAFWWDMKGQRRFTCQNHLDLKEGQEWPGTGISI
jgi:hypothetical protein